MPCNTTVILGDHFAQVIADKVGLGRYAAASNVVRAGLRLLEEREAAVTALRAVIDEGERSGAPASLDIDAFLAERRVPD